MTSTRGGKAPLTPGARGATRNARLSRSGSRRRQPAMLRGMLMLSMLPLAKSPAPTSAMLQLVKDGQPLEDTAGGVRRCVDTVPPGVLEEHDCSAAAPCWALVRGEKRLTVKKANGVHLTENNRHDKARGSRSYRHDGEIQLTEFSAP